MVDAEPGRQRMSRSISTQIIVVLYLCATLILGTGMALDYRLSSNTVLERMRFEAGETIELVVSDIDNLLDGVEGSTVFFGRVLQQREYSLPGLQQMLKDIVENNSDVYGATIALNPEYASDPLGFAPYYYRREGVLTFADLSHGQQRYWQRDWYANAVQAGKPVWSEPYFDTGGGEVWMTTYSVPVYRSSAAGERSLYAVVTADITLEELHQYLQHLRLGNSGYGVLLSNSGAVLSSEVAEPGVLDFRRTLKTPAATGNWDSIIQALRQGQTLSRDIACPNTDDSCKVRLSVLQSTGWPVGVVYSEAEVLAPLREFQLKTAALSIATLLLLALAVYVVTSRLTRPLTALAHASDGIARGKLDIALPRARGDDEVARLVRSFSSMREDLQTYIADLEAATASRSRLEGELAAAREIQMSMLPQNGEAFEECEQYALWAMVRPAKSVGGDLYAYSRRQNQLFIAVGDVSDKGVPAALFMARAMSLIQQLAATEHNPATAMAQLNDALEAGNDICMFVTLFLGVVDLDTLALRFASAGHHPPSLLRSNTVQLLQQEDGPALGLAAGLVYPGNTMQLEPGDRLAIYTDGIDEAFNEQAAMFGIDRCNVCLAQSAATGLQQAGQALFQAIDQHAGSMPQSDDITLMLLQLPPQGLPAQAPGEASRASATFPLGEKLTSRALDWLQATLCSLQLEQALHMDLMLLAEEIISNIDKYGGLPQDAEIELTVQVNADQVGLEVRDEGIAFNPLQEGRRATLGADIESAEIGGLGVHLIAQLSDRQSYRRIDGRNSLRVVKLRQHHTACSDIGP